MYSTFFKLDTLLWHLLRVNADYIMTVLNLFINKCID
jgi:hypothetical protein